MNNANIFFGSCDLLSSDPNKIDSTPKENEVTPGVENNSDGVTNEAELVVDIENPPVIYASKEIGARAVEVVTPTKNEDKVRKEQEKLDVKVKIAEVLIAGGGYIKRKTLNKEKNPRDVLCVRKYQTKNDIIVGTYSVELENILVGFKEKYHPKEKVVVETSVSEPPKIEKIIGTKIKGTATSTGVIKQNIQYVEYELGLIQELGREVKLALDSAVTLDVDAKKDYKKGAESYMSIVKNMLKLKLDAKALADKDIALVIAKQAIDELQTYIYQLKRMNDVLMAVLCGDCRKKAMWVMVTSLPREEVEKIAIDSQNQNQSPGFNQNYPPGGGSR